MKDLTSGKFREGMKVKCQIYSRRNNTWYDITDAKLHYHQNGNWYICQNIIEGKYCQNRLGYKYSWCIGSGSKEDLVTNKIIHLSGCLSLKEKLQILKKELQR